MSKEMRLLLNIIRWILGCFFLICALVYLNDGFALTPILWFFCVIVVLPILDNRIKLDGRFRATIAFVLVLSATTSVSYTDSYKNRALVQVMKDTSTASPKAPTFSENDAIQKMQSYPVSGITLLEMYESQGDMKGIVNKGWYAENPKNNVYVVSFSQDTPLGESMPKWEVTEEKIVAINGAALKYTPELIQPTPTLTGNARDKEIYEYLKPLFKKYLEGIDPSDTDTYDTAEKRAIIDAAEHFGISESDVMRSWFNVREY